ncbi:MAG: hypothetical protein EAZ16_00605 [Sphingobacteriales bacterium]|nr:MAG: hypothetical protein EAZ16_00605 [Sphingobacteriales bacterium]
MNTNDIIGTIGVGIILVAYFLQTVKLIKTGVLFYALNAMGAGIACYASHLISYYPFVVLEAVWCLVSVIGLIKLSYARNQ